MKNKGRLHPDCPWETGRTPPQRKICSSTWGQFCIVLTWRKIVSSKYPMWDLASQSMATLASCCMIRDRHYCLTCKALWTGYVKYNSQGHSGRTWQWSDVTMTVHCVWNTLINIRIWILLSNYLPPPTKRGFLLFVSLGSNDLLTATDRTSWLHSLSVITVLCFMDVAVGTWLLLLLRLCWLRSHTRSCL